ncbi:methyltransferase [Frankia sp. AgB32]|uniref:methyltransferase n=1 Tax=Frankia sp. AgB32 TaxID=631119 RepID=UPI00200D7BA3|nr:methyltransferase [Frankia sp. AgB32]MCK9897148.1 methyltransferase [Frankia sp. AgB32]
MTFYDPVESAFYSWCVERLLTSADLRPYTARGVVELGAGSGRPLIDAVRRAESTSRIRGFEHDPQAYRTARRMIDLKGPATYTVELGDFFAHAETAPERCVIANPPYLPARGPGPDLYGGRDGAEVTCRLLGGRFDLVMLMVSSIADPLGVLAQAAARGYRLVDWSARPIRFGRHCRQPAVWNRIQALAAAGEAFYGPDEYLLAGITWLRDDGAVADTVPGADPAVLAQVLCAGNGAVAA